MNYNLRKSPFHQFYYNVNNNDNLTCIYYYFRVELILLISLILYLAPNIFFDCSNVKVVAVTCTCKVIIIIIVIEKMFFLIISYSNYFFTRV